MYREFVYQTRRRITAENSTQFKQHVRKHMARRCAMCMREVRKDSWDMTVGEAFPFEMKPVCIMRKEENGNPVIWRQEQVLEVQCSICR